MSLNMFPIILGMLNVTPSVFFVGHIRNKNIIKSKCEPRGEAEQQHEAGHQRSVHRDHPSSWFWNNSRTQWHGKSESNAG